MKRLVESAETPLEQQAAALLREVPPLGDSDLARARVRRAMERRSVRGRAGGPKGGLIAVILLGAGVSAAAVWGGVSELLSESTPASAPHEEPAGDGNVKRGLVWGTPPHVEAPQAAAPNAATPPEALGAQLPETAEPTPDAAARPPESGAPGSGELGPNKSVPRARRPSAAAAGSSDAILVQRAIDVLRNEGDAERATELLDEYRKKGQNRALSEEALALSIEAALINDPPRAKRLALQYLAAYPSGRFKPLAVRAAGH